MPCCQLFAAGSDTYTSYGYCETITPDSGYQMAEGSLTYSLAVAGGETVKITGNRFTMPAGNVTITCKWETATTTVKGITSFSINGVAGAVNNSTNTITITMPRGTDVTKLTPVIATNGVKSLTPGNGETVDFTNAVTYTAAMEDGSSKTYTVTVYVDKGTPADQFWDRLTDFATQVPWWQYAEKQQSTSKYPKYWYVVFSTQGRLPALPAASFLFSFLRCYEPAAFFKPEITLPAPYAAGISLSHAAYTLAGCAAHVQYLVDMISAHFVKLDLDRTHLPVGVKMHRHRHILLFKFHGYSPYRCHAGADPRHLDHQYRQRLYVRPGCL